MKLILQGHEIGDAVKQYLRDTYSLYGEVEVEGLPDVEVDIKPRNSMLSSTEVVTKSVSEPNTDTEREAAITRADELGIEYRSNIGTDTLIERIEAKEEEMSHPNYLASWETEENGYEVISPSDGNELPLENDVDTVVESDEPVEETSDEKIQEAQEEQPKKKKKSIFDKSE